MENGSVADFIRRGILTSFREDARIQFKLTFLSPFVAVRIHWYSIIRVADKWNEREREGGKKIFLHGYV